MHTQTVLPTPARLERAAGALAIYSVAGVFLGYGAYKFTSVEAQAIYPLVSNSPLLGWLYHVFSVQGVSNLIGTVEIVSALAMLWRRDWRVSLTGSLCVALALVVTVSFIVTTPNAGGSAFGFLIKDTVLLGVALLAAARAWDAGHKTPHYMFR